MSAIPAGDIRYQSQIILTDHFMENGILQFEMENRQLLAPHRDHEKVELVVGTRIVDSICRKNQGYLLSVELKEICEKLRLDVGAKISMIRRISDPRRLYIILPVSEDRLNQIALDTDGFSESLQFEVEYPKLSESQLSNEVRETLDSLWNHEITEEYDSKLEMKSKLRLEPDKKWLEDTNSTRNGEQEDYKEVPEQSDLKTFEDFNISDQWSVMLAALKELQMLNILGASNLMGVVGLNDVDQYPHQLRTVRKVLFETGGRAILADEVGLGKTVEAGLILREYYLRGQMESLLVLTPASLTHQWQEELGQKFELDLPVIQSVQDVNKFDRFIISLDLAKTSNFRSIIGSRSWDMVIVDEAHKLKNSKTLNFQFVKGLTSRYLLLLTATPIQNELLELFNLVHLIAPGSLGTPNQFRKSYVHPVNKKLPQNERVLRQRLSRYMIRNCRLETHLKLPPRRVLMRRLNATKEEKIVYESLTQFIRESYYMVSRVPQGLNQLTLMLLQKLATSSPEALRLSIEGILKKGELSGEMEDSFINLREGCLKVDRAVKFVEVMRFITEEAQGDKVIVFTQFRATQQQLVKLLQKEGISTAEFHGEMNVNRKRKQVEKFRKESQILVSTDCGAEGWNLQFARILINFDLPWNPMKVEQRIGRVHRLGQEREVLILNFCIKDTIEEHIVNLLSHKIRLFERVVGELEMILGHLSGDLKEIESLDSKIMEILVKYTDDSDQRKEIETLGDEFKKAGHNFEQVRKLQENFLGKGSL